MGLGSIRMIEEESGAQRISVISKRKRAPSHTFAFLWRAGPRESGKYEQTPQGWGTVPSSNQAKIV